MEPLQLKLKPIKPPNRAPPLNWGPTTSRLSRADCRQTRHGVYIVHSNLFYESLEILQGFGVLLPDKLLKLKYKIYCKGNALWPGFLVHILKWHEIDPLKFYFQMTCFQINKFVMLLFLCIMSVEFVMNLIFISSHVWCCMLHGKT